MRFSIITAAFNHKKYLPNLLEALENQTFKDFGWHIVDDGSDDGTDVWVKDIKASFPISYHRQRHKGMRLAKNINQGIKDAIGEYCIFIMGDSFPDPTYLEVMNNFARPDRMLCGVRYHIDEGRGVDIDWRLKKKVIPPENVLLPKYSFEVATGNGLVIPTEAMRKYGMWDEGFKKYGGEDNEIVARLYYKGYLFYSLIDAKLYHHYHIAQRTNPESSIYLKKKLQEYAGISNQNWRN